MSAQELFVEVKDHVLFTESYKPSGIYFCTKCRRVSGTKEWAESCCSPTVACGECGRQHANKGWTKCSDCQDKASKKAYAEKVKNAPYTTEYDWLYLESADKYFSDMEEFEDYIKDLLDDAGIKEAHLDRDPNDEYDYELENIPDFLWACESKGYAAPDIVDWVQEDCMNDHYEDAHEHLENLDELKEFFDKWAEKQTVKSYWPTDKKVDVSEFRNRMLKERGYNGTVSVGN